MVAYYSWPPHTPKTLYCSSLTLKGKTVIFFWASLLIFTLEPPKKMVADDNQLLLQFFGKGKSRDNLILESSTFVAKKAKFTFAAAKGSVLKVCD